MTCNQTHGGYSFLYLAGVTFQNFMKTICCCEISFPQKEEHANVAKVNIELRICKKVRTFVMNVLV